MHAVRIAKPKSVARQSHRQPNLHKAQSDPHKATFEPQGTDHKTGLVPVVNTNQQNLILVFTGEDLIVSLRLACFLSFCLEFRLCQCFTQNGSCQQRSFVPVALGGGNCIKAEESAVTG